MTRGSTGPLIVAIALTAAACSGGGGGGLSDARSDTPTDDPSSQSSELVLGPGQTTHSIGVTFQYAGFAVTVGESVYDEERDELLVALRFRNLSTMWATPDMPAALRTHGIETPMLGVADEVPPQASAEQTVSFPSVRGDPFEDGTIVFGRAGTFQPALALDTLELANAMTPADIRVDAWGRIGKFAVHVTVGHFLAGHIDRNVQAATGERVLRLDYDLYTARRPGVSGFDGGEHLRLVRPDGRTIEAGDSSEPLAPLSWTVAAANWVEFPVSDSPEGDYTLELSSLSPISLGTFHPELIERVPIPIHIDVPETPGREPAAASEQSPRVTLIDRSAMPEPGKPYDADLDVGAINPPGFAFVPRHIRWDPATRTATIRGEATYLQTDGNPSSGVLSAPIQVSSIVRLYTMGRFFTGIVDQPTIERGKPATLTFTFSGIDQFDPEDAGLHIGPRSRLSSSLALHPNSPVPAYPGPIRLGSIDAPTVTAGDWTVALKSFRVGLLRDVIQPATGQLDLEVFFDVTVSPSANVPALGLRFTPINKFFVTGADGYLHQAAADSDPGEFQPGETKSISATFHVGDTFSSGRYGFAVRSGDEVRDFAITEFTEVVFGAQLAGTSVVDVEG